MKFIEKYKYPLSIILAALIIGVAMLLVQVNKQESIEYQKKLESDAKTAELEFERMKYEDEKNAERAKELSLDYCLMGADDAYWDYVKLNMTEKDDGTYWGPNWRWDEAESRRKTKQDSCYKQYK